MNAVRKWRRNRAMIAAYKAFLRCYGVPYERELSVLERRGMHEWEALGWAVSDEGVTGKHWHRRSSSSR